MRLLEKYIVTLLKEEEAKEKTVMAVIDKVRPNLEKMSRAELELLQLKIDKMVKELG